MSNKRGAYDYKEARRLALRAYHKQNGLCFWCRKPMLLKKSGTNDGVEKPRLMTADHLKSWWKGGQTIPGNIVAACWLCNHTRDHETNHFPLGTKISVGDDTLHSPFEILKGIVND